jgi:LysM repeat protein
MNPSMSENEPMLWLEFPRAVSLHNAQLLFRATESQQTHFTIHSLFTSSETSNDGYWVYAGQPNFSMKSLEKQLRQGIPSSCRLVVLELGAQELRDYSGSPTALNQWKATAQRLVAEIQRQVPEADIVLVSPMAQLRGGRPNPLSQTWSFALRELAEELDCGYFDWFRISGGMWAMQDWIDAGWARYDGQWLNHEGQKIWEKCWWLAWNQSLLATGPELWVSDKPVYQAPPRSIDTLNMEAETPTLAPIAPAEPFLPSFHTVSPGETLYSISKRYNCSVSQLQAINGMGQSTQIRIGQKLRVPRP